MHISLVPRHNVGENIFLPKQCVPSCEFFLVTVWYAYVHVILVLDKRNRNERVSCFPALSGGFQTLPSGQQHLLRDPCRAVSCTSHVVSASLSPPFPPPPVPTVVPGATPPLGPAEVGTSCPASGVCAARAAHTWLCSRKSAF